MASTRPSRRLSAVIGGGAIIAMIGFTAACSSESDAPEESTTTTTTTTTPPATSSAEPTVSLTVKAPNPDGTNIFTPPVVAPQPTVNQDRDRYGQ